MSASMKLRPRAADEVLREVCARLTERDRHLLRMLDDHRVLTTAQVRGLGFATIRRAQARLDQLHALRVVDRFRPFRATGSAPYHWVLDWAGAAVLYADRDDRGDLDKMTWRKERALAVARSSHLAHRVGTNGFFTALVHEARVRRAQGRDASLLFWWSARECDRRFGSGWKYDQAHPDGACEWREDGATVTLLLEWDCGTETLSRLADKLPGYAKLRAGLADDWEPLWVGFRFPSARREAEARRALEKPVRVHRLQVATCVLAPGESPAGAVWLPVQEPPQWRLRLIDLAGVTRSRRRHSPTEDAGAAEAAAAIAGDVTTPDDGTDVGSHDEEGDTWL